MFPHTHTHTRTNRFKFTEVLKMHRFKAQSLGTAEHHSYLERLQLSLTCSQAGHAGIYSTSNVWWPYQPQIGRWFRTPEL